MMYKILVALHVDTFFALYEVSHGFELLCYGSESSRGGAVSTKNDKNTPR